MKNTAFHMITGLLALGLMFATNLAQSQAGSLDTTFGTGGIVTTASRIMLVANGAEPIRNLRRRR